MNRNHVTGGILGMPAWLELPPAEPDPLIHPAGQASGPEDTSPNILCRVNLDKESGHYAWGDRMTDGKKGALRRRPVVAKVVTDLLGEPVEHEVNLTPSGDGRAGGSHGDEFLSLLEDPGSPLVDALCDNRAKVSTLVPVVPKRSEAYDSAFGCRTSELINEALGGRPGGGDTEDYGVFMVILIV